MGDFSKINYVIDISKCYSPLSQINVVNLKCVQNIHINFTLDIFATFADCGYSLTETFFFFGFSNKGEQDIVIHFTRVLHKHCEYFLRLN